MEEIKNVETPIEVEETPVEAPAKKAKKGVDKKRFIARKLKVINEMPDKAKAKAIAARVLSNQ